MDNRRKTSCPPAATRSRSARDSAPTPPPWPYSSPPADYPPTRRSPSPRRRRTAQSAEPYGCASTATHVPVPAREAGHATQAELVADAPTVSCSSRAYSITPVRVIPFPDRRHLTISSAYAGSATLFATVRIHRHPESTRMLPTPRLPGLFPMRSSRTRMLTRLDSLSRRLRTPAGRHHAQPLPHRNAATAIRRGQSLRPPHQTMPANPSRRRSQPGRQHESRRHGPRAGRPRCRRRRRYRRRRLQVPFQFTMFGDWIVTASAVVDADAGDTVIANFDLSVDAGGAKLSKP